MTGYIVRHHFGMSITTVKYTRKTDASYWYMTPYGQERRCKRLTEYENFYETFEEAKEFALAKAGRIVRQAESRLMQAKGSLASIQSLSVENLTNAS